MVGKRRNYIFDLDGTLSKTNWQWELAHVEACALVLEYLGHAVPYRDQLSKNLETFDDAFVQLNGYGEGYYARMLVSFLEQACANAGVPASQGVRKKMEEIARIPLDSAGLGKQDLIEGAEETLEFVLNKGDLLYLVTRGVKRCQEEKIQRLGLRTYFKSNDVYVVEKNDKRDVLKEISKGKDPESVFVVDDALAMINDAVELGLWGMFIPPKRGTRKREKGSNGILRKYLTIPLEDIRLVKQEYAHYRLWDDRSTAGDLPEYIVEYDKKV